MKELGKWQVISFISRGIAMGIGMVQGFVIAAVLTKAEWGIVQLAVSIGGALGIYQHLGLASASTREISSAEKEDDVFKIFLTSIAIRYCVTIPIALGLFFGSNYIATHVYKNVLLDLPLKIYGLTLLFQGAQSILNSVISGTKRFKQIFIYQAVIALVSLTIYLPFIYFYRINGYFYAFMLFNFIATLSLAVIAFKPLRGKLTLPTKREFRKFLKEIFSISIAIYLMKILVTNWEKLGSNVLGLTYSVEVVATFAFALLYAKKLMSISDSVTDVNLPVLSDKYVHNQEEFRELFTKNFNKLFCIILFIGSFAAYFAPFIVRLAVGNKYDDSLVLIAPLIITYMLYSFVNIINSSVLIPAKMTRHMMVSFVLLLLGTIAFFFGVKSNMEILPAMAWAMAFGTLVALVAMLIFIYKKIKLSVFNIDHLAIFFGTVSVVMLCTCDILWLKLVGLVFFVPLEIASFTIPAFISTADLRKLLAKAGSISRTVLRR
jgi:O-antigen/teichoic acid export membrane protein